MFAALARAGAAPVRVRSAGVAPRAAAAALPTARSAAAPAAGMARRGLASSPPPLIDGSRVSTPEEGVPMDMGDFDVNELVNNTEDRFGASMFPEALVNSKLEPYVGIAAEPFSAETREMLSKPLSIDDVEIRPDGQIYLPEIKYRRVLNQAFGAGAWALIPRAGSVININKAFSREYALYCNGRFVSSARGEQQYTNAASVSYGNAEEGAKSNALMRCCKDLGIASELWDPNFIIDFKKKYATEAWVESVQTGQKRKLWRRSDRPNSLPWPWREVESTAAGLHAQRRSSSSSSSSGPRPPSPMSAAEALGQDKSVSPAFDSFAASLTAAAASSSPLASNSGSGSGTSTSTSTSTGSSGRSGAETLAANSRAPPTEAEMEGIDIDAPVPASMKKFFGKTYREVGATDQGRVYLLWASTAKSFTREVNAAAAKAYAASSKQ